MRIVLKYSTLILCGLIIVSPFSEAITRVGGGSVKSSLQGYEVKIPLYFDKIYLFAGDKARFQESALSFAEMRTNPLSGMGTISGTLTPKFIDLRLFSEEYPAYATLSSKELVDLMAKNKWSRFMHSNSCVLVFTKESPTTSFAVATWGKGKGIVLIGDKTNSMSTAIKKILTSLILTEGACQWR